MGLIKIPDVSISYFQNQVTEIFNSGNLAEGDWNKRVAAWAIEYTGASHATPFNSNGSGLLAILKILQTHKGKKRIFLQSNTMYGVKTIANTSGLSLCGFVNCQLDYLAPKIDDVIEFVGGLGDPQDCVFLLTHIGGWVNPDIVEIADFCRKKGISLVEDCAHSLGSTLNGRHTGLFGDAGVYSLYSTKAIPSGEGGILVTHDAELGGLMDKFVIYDRFDQELSVGVNFRMSEINALLAYSVVSETENIIKNKKSIAEQYIRACNDFGWDYIDPDGNGQRANLYKFILLQKSDTPPERWVKFTKRTSSVYDYQLGDDAQELATRHMCLPVWYLLEQEIVDGVLQELRSII